MPNKTATLQLSATYTGPDNNAVSMPAKVVTASYQGQNHGQIDVPDATASATNYALPFGSIGVTATAGIIENSTGQTLEVFFNGAVAASFTLPNGGMYMWGFAGLSGGGTPITAAAVKTTALQSGQGYVNYHLFGDPV